MKVYLRMTQYSIDGNAAFEVWSLDNRDMLKKVIVDFDLDDFHEKTGSRLLANGDYLNLTITETSVGADEVTNDNIMLGMLKILGDYIEGTTQVTLIA